MAGGKHILAKQNAQRVFGTAKVGDRGQIVIPKEAREFFGIDPGDSFTVWELSESHTVKPEEFHSMGRATPYAGETLYGRCVLTVANGKIVYKATTD